METLILKAIVCPAEYDVELAHLAGPVLGHEALHEQAVTIADAVSMWLITASPRFLSLKSLE